MPLQFTGSAAEYFRIWIVNVCLTLLTLGIFSAWAKVRKKRYFYSHTRLDGTPFQYLGQPIPILKGRIVAAVLFGFWYAGTHFVPDLKIAVLAAAFVLAPWVLVRSAAFNARYSAFRNMTFHFNGTYWSAAKTLYGWALPPALVLGGGSALSWWSFVSGRLNLLFAVALLTVLLLVIAFSWWQQRIKQYMVTHFSYGGVRGEFGATGRQFLRTYFLASFFFAVGAAAIGGLIGAAAWNNRGQAAAQTHFLALTVGIYAMYVAVFAYTRARIANLVWNHTQLGPLKFQSRLTARSLLALYLTNLLAIAASLGLLIPWAVIRTHKYRAARFSVMAEGEISDFAGRGAASVQAAGAEVGELFDFDMSI